MPYKPEEQMEGLFRLRDILIRHEVNCALVPPGSDMGYIEMLHTPRGPHAIFDPHTKTYDIWKWGRKRPGMKYRDLSAEDAAEILTTEYFLAKAKRIRKRRPDMSMVEIMQTLRRGYQNRKKKETDVVRRDN